MARVSRTIFVRNIPYSCTNDNLEELFSAYGPVKQCFIVKDKNSGKSRGIGYVTYTLRDDAIKAKDEKVNIDGRRLLLDFADIAKKAKNKRNQNKDEQNEPESEEDDNIEEKSDKKGKNEQEKLANLKYHKAKIILLTGLGNKLNEERLNGCLQKLNVKNVAEVKLVSDDSAHVKFKCIRDAKRAVNRLHEHEYKGSKLTASQLSKDAANIPPKMLKRCRLIVRNLAFKCQEKDLQRSFEKFGALSDIKVATNTDGQSLGFGFVQYLSLSDAKQAIDAMNSTKIAGRQVAVDWAIPKNKYETFEAEKKKSAAADSDDEDEGSFSSEGDMNIDKQDGKRKRNLSDDEGYSENDDSDDDNDEDKQEVKSADSDESEGSNSDESDDDESESDDDDTETKKGKFSNGDDDRVDVDQGKTIFIRNLSYDTEEDKLGEFFEKYGDLNYARVVVDFNTEHSRGMAFVKFKSKESADKCLEAVDSDDLILDGRKLSITLAVSRQKSAEFNEKKKKEKKDSRNLYLAREGYVRPGTQASVGLSDTDLKKRAQVEMVKRQKLKNINIFVSTVRLCVRNIPLPVTDKQLREVFLKAAQDKKAKVIECRIMRDQKRVNATSGIAKSQGYGFVSFTEHQHALDALRHTNNNPDIFGEKKRMIVEFSLENRKALEAKEKRKNRQILKTEILKKNTDMTKSDKKFKIDKEKLKAVQKPELSLIKLSEEDKKSKAKLPKGMPTHTGPKVRHKARQSQQSQQVVKKKNFNQKHVHQPRQAQEGPPRKKQKIGKKNETDQFDRLVASYKNNLMGQGKSKWYK